MERTGRTVSVEWDGFQMFGDTQRTPALARVSLDRERRTPGASGSQLVRTEPVGETLVGEGAPPKIGIDTPSVRAQDAVQPLLPLDSRRRQRLPAR
jgi:hypothetical protein